MASRPAIPAEVERAVRERDKDACVDCGEPWPCDLDHDPPWEYVKEHKVSGIFLRCRACHKKKSARELKNIRATTRKAKKHNGTYTRKKREIPSRKFQKSTRKLQSRGFN